MSTNLTRADIEDAPSEQLPGMLTVAQQALQRIEAAGWRNEKWWFARENVRLLQKRMEAPRADLRMSDRSDTMRVTTKRQGRG